MPFNQLGTAVILMKAGGQEQSTTELAINLTQGLRSEPVNKWSFILYLGLFVPPFQIPVWTQHNCSFRGKGKKCHNREVRKRGTSESISWDTRDRTPNTDFGLRGLLPAATSVSKPHKQTNKQRQEKRQNCSAGWREPLVRLGGRKQSWYTSSEHVFSGIIGGPTCEILIRSCH